MEPKTIYENENYELRQTAWRYHISASPNSKDWEVSIFFDTVQIAEEGDVDNREYYLLDGHIGEAGMISTKSMPKELCNEIDKLPRADAEENS